MSPRNNIAQNKAIYVVVADEISNFVQLSGAKKGGQNIHIPLDFVDQDPPEKGN